jgi:murein DD-endopeptidase MepM/ murein hydrolase activator NlpD
MDESTDLRHRSIQHGSPRLYERVGAYAQWAAGVTLFAAMLLALVLHGRPEHSAHIDEANLELAAAMAEREAVRTRWHAAIDVAALTSEDTSGSGISSLSAHREARTGQLRADRQAALVARQGQAVLSAAHAELQARRLYAYTERYSYADLAIEQVRTLLQPPEPHAEPPLHWPLDGAVVSGYGLRAWPDFGRLHPGIDIVNLPGTPIRAAADGVVVGVRKDLRQGNSVVLDHGEQEPHPGRWTTVYGHLEEITVMERQRVRAGDKIGTLGNTGEHSTGPHLHFEVRIENQPVDPRRWLP